MCRRRGLEIHSFGATQFNHDEPIRCSDFSEHPINVILHGLFGNIQPRRYLFIGQAIPDQADQLLFSQAEAKVLL